MIQHIGTYNLLSTSGDLEVVSSYDHKYSINLVKARSNKKNGNRERKNVMWERNMDIVLYVIYESKYTYYQKDQEKRERKGMQNNSGSEIQKLTRPQKNYLMLNFPMSLNSSTPIFPDWCSSLLTNKQRNQSRNTILSILILLSRSL